MYILANGIKISEKTHQHLCGALKDTSQKRVYFLDINRGKLICVPSVYRRKLETIEKEPQKFISLPRVNEEELRGCFGEFNRAMVDIPKLQSRLDKEIKKGVSMKKLEKILENDPSGWIHGWAQWEQFLLAERIEEWITEPPLGAKDDPDYWFDDDCSLCQLLKKAEEEGKTPTIKETKETFLKAKKKGAVVGGEWLKEKDIEDEKKWMKKRGLESIGNVEDFKMPKWMECAWRRVSCDKDDCPICGRIKRDRQRHIEQGEDPDDIKSVFKDVGRNFKDVLEMIKKDCQARGIELNNIENIKEPPEPEKFPFYRKVKKWRDSVYTIADSPTVGFWIQTIEAQDLLWYSNTLMAKVYRQLCNKWHIKNGDDYGEFDYEYTSYVLGKCFKILKESLKKLAQNNQTQKKELDLIYSNLLKLEKEIEENLKK